MGGTKLAARLTEGGHTIEKTTKLPTPKSAETDLLHITNFLKELNTNSTGQIMRCAIASAPTVDRNGVVTRWPNRPYWKGIPLRSKLEDILNCSVIFEDDGNAAALAEAFGTGAKNLIYIGIGTGIGGGLIIDGRIYRGSKGESAEIGHMLITTSGGSICQCGRAGCLQAYASVPAIMSRAFPEAKESLVSDLRNALNTGQERACGALNKAADAIAAAIISLSELLDPEYIVIGGGFADSFPELYDRIKEASLKLLRQGQSLPNIRSGIYGSRASLEGAVIITKQAA